MFVKCDLSLWFVRTRVHSDITGTLQNVTVHISQIMTFTLLGFKSATAKACLEVRLASSSKLMEYNVCIRLYIYIHYTGSVLRFGVFLNVTLVAQSLKICTICSVLLCEKNGIF